MNIHTGISRNNLNDYCKYLEVFEEIDKEMRYRVEEVFEEMKYTAEKAWRNVEVFVSKNGKTKLHSIYLKKAKNGGPYDILIMTISFYSTAPFDTYIAYVTKSISYDGDLSIDNRTVFLRKPYLVEEKTISSLMAYCNAVKLHSFIEILK